MLSEMDPANISDQLHPSWKTLMKSLSVEESIAEELFELVVSHYEDDSRYYHDLRHIRAVLAAIETQKHHAEDFKAIQLAAWFHDIIYEKAGSESEAKSALLAERLLGRAGVAQDRIDAVVRMIRATEINHLPPEEMDAKILADADLATLGSEAEVYDLNAARIRQEYAHIPESDYREGRKRILHKFLKRERIFLTEEMYQLYESRARQNIKREIASLS